MLFKSILLSILLFSSTVQAQLVPAESVEDAKKQVEEKCVETCLILSPEELANIEANIAAAIRDAYLRGLKGWEKST